MLELLLCIDTFTQVSGAEPMIAAVEIELDVALLADGFACEFSSLVFLSEDAYIYGQCQQQLFQVFLGVIDPYLINIPAASYLYLPLDQALYGLVLCGTICVWIDLQSNYEMIALRLGFRQHLHMPCVEQIKRRTCETNLLSINHVTDFMGIFRKSQLNKKQGEDNGTSMDDYSKELAWNG